MGLPTLFSSLFQTVFTLGYEARPVEAIAENFLGGFLKFPAQEATGILDDLSVRAVCLDDNSGRGVAAFAWIDCVGFMNADVKAIREKLSDLTGEGKLISIDTGSTHIHSTKNLLTPKGVGRFFIKQGLE